MNRDVTVRGRRMHACLLGSGDITIVLLSGSCVPLPQLEYRPLIKALAKDQFVVLLEKFGYGGSDSTPQPRDLQHVVAEYREALAALDVPLPVVLAAHSMGFLEALYWAQHYPEEVLALIGVDPATPESYQDFDIDRAEKRLRSLSKKPLMQKLAADQYCRQLFRRLSIPRDKRADLEAKALRSIAGPVWLAECEALPGDLSAIAALPPPRTIPVLFFLSNGKGTSMSTALWRQHGTDFLKNMVYSEYILLDLPHNLYQLAPDLIARKITSWLGPVIKND